MAKPETSIEIFNARPQIPKEYPHVRENESDDVPDPLTTPISVPISTPETIDPIKAPAEPVPVRR